MKNPKRLLILGALMPAFSPFAFAQSASVQDGEDIIELSPFTVDASQNQGYYSPSTLAGTRIRTDLKDIGTSIQVVTKEFMDDIDADDAQTLLNYTTNTEVGGIQGNYSGNDASDPNVSTQESRGNPQSATRIRGLFKADLTRNYFRTLIPFDSYNTQSVDINRGSNAVLFGLGSPAGIINNTLEGATFKNSGEIGVRFDEFGSWRASLNVNQQIIEDKLAVRGAVVKDNRQYYQDPTYQDRERLYLAGAWRITDSTTLRANFETGRTDANRPDSTSPIESITPWLMMGKPILDYSLATGIGRDLNAPTGIKVDKDGDGVLDDVYPVDINADRIYTYLQRGDGSFVNEGNWTWDGKFINAPNPPTIPGAEKSKTGGVGQPKMWGQATIVFGDPFSSEPTIPGFKAQWAGNENYVGDAFISSGDNQDFRPRFVGTGNMSAFFNNWKPQGYTNLNGYDWGKNLLGGTTADQSDDFSAFNITLEQTFFDRKMGVEFAFDKQSYDYDFFTPLQLGNTAQILPDMNVRLPDGRPNPNLGRPFMLARNFRMYRYNDLETYRVTGYVKHDFAEQFENGWGKWLGRHAITGLFDRNEESKSEFRAFQVWDDRDVRRVLRVNDAAMNLNAFASRVFPIVYVGPSLLDPSVQSLEDVVLTPPSGLELWQPGRTVPITYWDPGSSAEGVAAKDKATVVAEGKLVTANVPIREAITEKSNINKTTTDSFALVHQGHFLGDHVVTTLGYRRDKVDSYLYTNPPTDEMSIHQIDAPLDQWDSQLATADEDRWSGGVVVHLPAKWTEFSKSLLSFHWAKSSNFSLEPGRVNWNNEDIGNPGGETEEMGFSVTAFEGRLHARVNWYETNLIGRTSPGAPNLVWNTLLQRTNSYFTSAEDSADPVFQDFNRAVGMAMINNVTEGESVLYPNSIQYNDTGDPVGLTYDAARVPSDTDDVSADGIEFEVTYNPLPNWRIHFNLARQNTVLSNVFPNTIGQYEQRLKLMDMPVPGYEWLKVGDLSYNPTNEENWIIDPTNKIYGPIDDPSRTDYTTMRENLETRMINYRTKKASEGSRMTEQRQWRFNVVTNYSFSSGALKGVSVGGAWRWQDKVAVGFPFITDEEGNTVGDVDNPVYAGRLGDIDLFASYRLPFFKDIGRWDVRLYVRNLLASNDDIIPVQLQGDGVSFSRYRLRPQREISLSSTFRF